MNNQYYTAPSYQPGYQPGFQQPPPQAQQQQFYTTQPIIMGAPMAFGTNPQSMTWNAIVTRIIHDSGTGTWVIAGVICLFGFWCGCQFIPFCVDSCKDVKHFCPNCNTYLGMKRLM